MKERKKLSNSPRERGMSPPSRAVEEFEVGEKVHIDINKSLHKGRPHPRFQGHTGEIIGSQGRAYKVEIKDKDKTKTLIVTPHHLKRP